MVFNVSQNKNVYKYITGETTPPQENAGVTPIPACEVCNM